MKAALLLVTLLAPALSHASADLDGQRIRQAKSYFLKQANGSGTKIFQALQDLRETPNALPETLSAGDLQVVESDSEICAHSVDGVENRGFLVMVKYQSFQRSNTDENGDYRSNTVGTATKLFRCEMSARKYGAKNAHWNCKAQD